jgi:hypothetical protein
MGESLPNFHHFVKQLIYLSLDYRHFLTVSMQQAVTQLSITHFEQSGIALLVSGSCPVPYELA